MTDQDQAPLDIPAVIRGDRRLALTAGNNAFSKTIPGLQEVWDSTSLGLFKTCPYKYYLTMLEGWIPQRQARPLAFGILVHECFELYDNLVAGGMSHHSAMCMAAKRALMFSGTRDSEGKFHPWTRDEDPNRTRESLVRTVVWYLDEYGENDPIKTYVLKNGRAAVELSFKFATDYKSRATGQPFFLSGHMDRLVQFPQGDIYVMDYKTTKSTISPYFFKSFSPGNQPSLYTLAAKVVLETKALGVIINGLQVGATFSRVRRGFATRTEAAIEEWYEDLGAWLALAEHYALEGHYPMNDESCSKYGGCCFQDICSKAPSVRPTFLEADFKRQIWDPTVNRGV